MGVQLKDVQKVGVKEDRHFVVTMSCDGSAVQVSIRPKTLLGWWRYLTLQSVSILPEELESALIAWRLAFRGPIWEQQFVTHAKGIINQLDSGILDVDTLDTFKSFVQTVEAIYE